MRAYFHEIMLFLLRCQLYKENVIQKKDVANEQIQHIIDYILSHYSENILLMFVYMLLPICLSIQTFQYLKSQTNAVFQTAILSEILSEELSASHQAHIVSVVKTYGSLVCHYFICSNNNQPLPYDFHYFR